MIGALAAIPIAGAPNVVACELLLARADARRQQILDPPPGPEAPSLPAASPGWTGPPRVFAGYVSRPRSRASRISVGERARPGVDLLVVSVAIVVPSKPGALVLPGSANRRQATLGGTR